MVVITSSLAEEIEFFRMDVRSRIRKLESLNKQLELIPVASTMQRLDSTSEHKAAGRKVFIVHGHDELAKESIARFVGNLEFESVVLSEQASVSRPLIEKFEDHANEIVYAIVLVTPDDVGAARADVSSTVYGSAEEAISALEPRARQNVILELGFFYGKLGRNQVCALSSGTVKRPSDIGGVAYVDMDAGDWRLNLAKEMKYAGLEVDLNRAI
jgi:predicted nucleotide-binding protein